MKKALSICGALVVSLHWCTASAGYRTSAPLTITGMTASGAIGQIRSSSNTAEGLFCTLQGCPTDTLCTQSYQLPSGLSVMCSASTGSTTLACTSTHPNLVSAMQAMGPDSYVLFTSNQFGSNGTCTKLQIVNGSVYAPTATFP